MFVRTIIGDQSLDFSCVQWRMIKNFRKGVNEGAIEDVETRGELLY